jgi:predicted 2-oxoglutarate/Fe(II)-dependent dioxygenase YbiX
MLCVFGICSALEICQENLLLITSLIISTVFIMLLLPLFYVCNLIYHRNEHFCKHIMSRTSVQPSTELHFSVKISCNRQLTDPK